MNASDLKAALRCGRSGCPCNRERGNVHCPAHDDQNPSFSVREVDGKLLFKCQAGCDNVVDVIPALVKRGLWQSADSRTHVRQVSPAVKPVKPLQSDHGITLESLAEYKKLQLDLLRSHGCCNRKHNNRTTVSIPYYSEDGTEVCLRSRISLDGADRFRWRKGDKPCLYGLDRLDDIRKDGWVLLVEGETDCWTAWQHKIPALGIPGKTNWHPEWADHVAGLTVYAWQEPEAEDLVKRLTPDLPGLLVVPAPDYAKDLSAAHLGGQDVPGLVECLKREARLAISILQELKQQQQTELRQLAALVLAESDPLVRIESAIRDLGYGGDITPALIVYLAATSRLLGMRSGAMLAHILLIGPPSSGKSWTITVVLRLLPAEAFVCIDAGSPRALIYTQADLQHRVLVFGEADSLPAGEDNPPASAIRNLLQENRLRYSVPERDSKTNKYVTREVEKPGPTVLFTTSVRKLGDQLDTRLFSVEMADQQDQVIASLGAQARLEMGIAPVADHALIAFQSLLQTYTPWDVLVPFAESLSREMGRLPSPTRINRDYARLLSLVKAVAILRHTHRTTDSNGRLIAEIADYRKVYELLGPTYSATATGAGEGIRKVVAAVESLSPPPGATARVTVSAVAKHAGITTMSASRYCRAAVKGLWLKNEETRRGAPYDLRVGDPLPPECGLPTPESLECNTVTAFTDSNCKGCTDEVANDDSCEEGPVIIL